MSALLPNPTTKKKCKKIADYYCKSWGCESSGDIWWPPPKQGDLIQLNRVSQSGTTYHQPRPINKGCPTPPNYNPIMINFTDLKKRQQIKNWVNPGESDSTKQIIQEPFLPCGMCDNQSLL
jgi:hypothetical protein